MKTIEKTKPVTRYDLEIFLEEIDFTLPAGFVDFYKDSNGAVINSDTRYVLLYNLAEMLTMHKRHNVEEYAPEFFLIGTNGGGDAFMIEKKSGHFYQMPFVAMLKEDSDFISDTFAGFIENL